MLSRNNWEGKPRQNIRGKSTGWLAQAMEQGAWPALTLPVQTSNLPL